MDALDFEFEPRCSYEIVLVKIMSCVSGVNYYSEGRIENFWDFRGVFFRVFRILVDLISEEELHGNS